MKNRYKIFALIILFTASFSQLKAQENPKHIVAVQTWIMNMPEDGSMKEFNSLMEDFFTKVTKKNDKVLSQYITRHFWGSDSRQLVIISEFASMNDMEASFELDNKLFEMAFPTKEERKKFNDAYGKYWDYHGDEIYTVLQQK